MGVPIETDMSHPGGRHEIEQSFQQPGAGAQDGDEAELLARQQGRHHRLQRGFDRHHLQRQIPHDLIAQQQAGLLQQRTELLGGFVRRRIKVSLC